MYEAEYTYIHTHIDAYYRQALIYMCAYMLMHVNYFFWLFFISMYGCIDKGSNTHTPIHRCSVTDTRSIGQSIHDLSHDVLIKSWLEGTTFGKICSGMIHIRTYQATTSIIKSKRIKNFQHHTNAKILETTIPLLPQMLQHHRLIVKIYILAKGN